MADRILRGWKEIAACLSTSERSAQRWAKEMGLPVLKLGDSRGAAVLAYEEDLKAWMAGIARQQATSPADLNQAVDVPSGTGLDGSGGALSDGRARTRLTDGRFCATLALVLSIPLLAWGVASKITSVRDSGVAPRRATLLKSVTLRLRAPGASDATLVAPDGGSTSVTLPGRPPFHLKSAVSGGRLRLEITQTGAEASGVAPLVVEIDPSATVRLKRPYPVELTWLAPAGPKVR